MNAVSSLTSDIAMAREAVAKRMSGIDPHDIKAQRIAYDAFSENDPLPEVAGQAELTMGGVQCLGLMPKGSSGDHIVLWLHGGGYVMGSSRSHKGLASQIAHHAGMSTVLPDYRLAPEHKFPAPLEDAVSVYQAVLGEGVKPQNVILAGDSAGGGLAVMTAMKLREEGVELPAGMLLLSPWVDMATSGWSIEAKAQRDPFVTRGSLQMRMQQYLGDKSMHDPAVDVLKADLRGLPPTMIQVGEAEILLSDSTSLAEKLGAAGVPVSLEIWPEMFHVFQARYKMLDHAGQAVERLGAWAKAHAVNAVADPA